MTDANHLANGHKLDTQSAGITPAISNGTSGIGAPAGDETRQAPESGGAGARQRPPGAASPAGWFPSPAGEAAPPVRNREPVRSGETMPDAEPDPRPTSWYRIPGPLSPGARRLLITTPRSASPTPQAGTDGPEGTADAPAPHWPLITRRDPRNIPVVGPTEALRARPGGPSVDASPNPVPAPASRERVVPASQEVPVPVGQECPCLGGPGGVPGRRPPSQPADRESGWQLAQRAWRDSGRDWETAPGRSPVPGPRYPDALARSPYGSGPYAADPYAAAAYASTSNGPDPYAPDAYGPDPYALGSYAAPYAPDIFAPDPYAIDPYAADDYPADDHPADQHAPSAYAPVPPAPDVYAAGRDDAGAEDEAPYRPGSGASRFDREDRDATRIDFGMPYRPPAVSPVRHPVTPPAPRFYPADPPAANDGPHTPGPSARGFHRADQDAADAEAEDAYPDDGYAGDRMTQRARSARTGIGQENLWTRATRRPRSSKTRGPGGALAGPAVHG